MKLFEQEKNEDMIEAITKILESDTGRKIFTLRVLSENEEGLETIIIFTDQTVLMGKISVQTIEGKMACRIQGNWI